MPLQNISEATAVECRAS